MTAGLSSSQKRFPFLRVGFLTVIFIAAFFVLRALPDAQCGFLHYEEVVNADGEVEFCATNHAGFLDLTRLKYPVRLSVDKAPSSDGSQQVTLQLETKGGMPIAPHELALTHTKKMHVMLIDPAMEDYHHVHPEPVGLDGTYTFTFKPESYGPYRIFTEIVPIRTRRQVIATGQIEAEKIETARPLFERRVSDTVENLRFALREVPEALRVNRDYMFTLDVYSDDSNPVNLEEVMGAKGHMVAFDEAGRGFAHMHPADSIVGAEDSNELSFLFNVPNPGWYRLFAQVQIGGKEVFGRFDLQVN